MTPGDVVLTPSWCWHGHANESDQSAFWLDFLDVPFVRHIGATSFEHYPEPFQRPVERDWTYRIPLNTVFGERSDMHTVEIAKGCDADDRVARDPAAFRQRHRNAARDCE